MRLSILLALAIAVILAGAFQLAIPPLLEHEIQKAVSASVDQVNYITVDAQAIPATKVVLGRIDKLTIDAKELVVEGLPIAAFLASFQGVQVDVRQILRGQLAVQSVRRLRTTVLLDEDGLNQYFWERVDKSKLFSIRLVGGFARLVGQVSLLGRPIELTLNGKFKIVGPTAVEYVPTELVVSQTRIPNFLLDAVMQERRFVIDLAHLPVPVEIESIKVENGRVYVFGRERQSGEK